MVTCCNRTVQQWGAKVRGYMLYRTVQQWGAKVRGYMLYRTVQQWGAKVRWLHGVIVCTAVGSQGKVVTCCNRTVQQWGAKVRWLHVVIELYSSGEPRYGGYML